MNKQTNLFPSAVEHPQDTTLHFQESDKMHADEMDQFGGMIWEQIQNAYPQGRISFLDLIEQKRHELSRASLIKYMVCLVHFYNKTS